MEIGKEYNWKGQAERMVYLGREFSDNRLWHQFALVSESNTLWCECLDSDLHLIEETIESEPEE